MKMRESKESASSTG